MSFGEGDIVDAKVINAVRGGLIVDVNGVRGFVPASMVAERFVSDLNQFRNKDIKAQVIEIDPANARLILSRKAVAAQERAAQLAEIFSKLSVGEVVEGTVARLTDFGAFVDLGGVDGLVHVSEISHDRVKNPADVLTKGEKSTLKFWLWILKRVVFHCQLKQHNVDLGTKQQNKLLLVQFLKVQLSA